MNLEFKGGFINGERIYVELSQGKHVDVTEGLADPRAALEAIKREQVNQQRERWHVESRLSV